MLSEKMKRILSLALAFLLTVSLMPVRALAAEADEEPTQETAATEPAETTAPAAEAPSEPETTSAEEPEAAAEPVDTAAVEALQARIDALLALYGITEAMTDNEIAEAIFAADGDTIQKTMTERDAIDAYAMEMFSEKPSMLKLDLYERFWNIFDPIFNPIPAVTVTGISGVEVTVDSNGSISESSGTVTVTVKGSFTSTKTTTITVKNTSGSTATISFDCTFKNKGSSTLDEGSNSILLTAGATQTYTLTSKSWTTSTTATATLNNFKVEAAAAESNVTVTYGSLGSVKIDGTTVASGSINPVSSSTGSSFVAVPGSGATFVAWIDPDDNTVISESATYQLIPTEDMNIRAVFASASTAPCFWANGKALLFESYDAAISYTSTASNKVITLAADGTLPAGDYTIPAGVTLLIPFDAAHTLCTTTPQTTSTSALTKPTAYRTLKMAADANITVNGAISVSGTQHSAMARGTPFGPVGYIDMASGSTITVNNGGNLYAWGYITGSGAVTVKSGGTVYESFQISDWRGGSATKAMQDNEEKIFPVTQYHVQNVEVPMTLEAGAYEKGFMSVNVTLVGIQTTTIDFVGPDSLFIINSGSITKDYDEATDRLIIDLNNCELNINTVTISVKVQALASVTLQSSDYILPIASNITVNVNSGSSVDLSQDMAFLPGTELNIAQGATCSVTGNASIIFYDVDNWGGYCGSGKKTMTYVSAVSSGNPAARAALADAAIKVNGTLDATNGYLYTTSAGGNIYSTGTGQVIQRAGTQTVTYQATYVEDGYTANPITITPAKLKNEDGKTPAFTDTSTATEATTYSYIDGVWQNCKRLDIVATNIAVNAGLDMWFYVKKADVVANGSPNYNAVITKVFADDRTDNPVIVTIPDDDWVAHTDNGVEYLRFCFSDISAKEMTDNITAVIYQADDNVQVSNTYVQTVQKYAIETLDAYKGKTDQKSEYLKKALMDMLEYGASAQAQFKNYNIDLPANIAPEGVTTLTDHAKYITTNDQDPKWEDVKDYEDSTHTVAGVTASATNTLMFTFYFDISLPAEQAFPNMYAVYEYTPHVVPGQSAEAVSKRVEGENFYDRIPQSLYGVDITTLSIIDGHQPITCTLYNADGSVAAVATDSIGGYAMRNKDNGAIFRDMMQFVDSAQAYFDYQS